MQAKLTAEQTVTLDELIAIADGLYKEMTAGKTHKDAMISHPEFAKSYPVVLRFIFERKQYDSTVFRRWITKFIKNPFKGEDEYLEAQADYVRMLFKRKNPRASPEDGRRVFKATLDMLKSERDQFKADYDRIKKLIDDRDDGLRAKTLEELAEYLKNMPPHGSLAIEKDPTMGAADPSRFELPPAEPLPVIAAELFQ
jgi:hypothetical protein